MVAAFKSKFQTPSFIWPFCKARKKYNEVLKTAYKVTNKMAMQRFEDPKAWDDIIGCFMNEFRDYDETELREHVRDQIATLVSVGYFTTSGLIRWILVELSRHPDIARRLQEEIDSVVGQRAPTIEDLTKCVYLSAFIKEVLRLNPTLFGIMRQSNEMDELGDYKIEKEDGIIVSPYHVHRHPDYWTNPEGFEPERFLENSLGQSHPFAYIPFGAGMRNCIGSSFSTLEAKLITIMLLQRCRLYLEPHAEVKPELTTLISMCPSVKNMRLLFTN